MKKHDFTIQNEGTIYLLRPETRRAKDWIFEYIPEDAIRWCGAIVIEHNYIDSIIDGIIGDGLSIN